MIEVLEEGNSELIMQEFELLNSVYADVIQINEGKKEVLVEINPSVGIQTDKSFVFLQMKLVLSESYPYSPPQIIFVKQKGLDEAQNFQILKLVNSKCIFYFIYINYDLELRNYHRKRMMRDFCMIL